MNNEKIITVMYLSGDSITLISKQLNIDRRSIYRILEKNDVSLRIRNKNICVICTKSCDKNICGTCNTNLRRYRMKKLAVEYLGGKCNRCNWSGDFSGYDFHHIDRAKKEYEVSGTNLAAKSWDNIKKELENCELLCALCHRLEHSNYQNEKFLSVLETYKGILRGN